MSVDARPVDDRGATREPRPDQDAGPQQVLTTAWPATAASVPAARHALAEFASAAGAACDVVEDVALAVSEAVTNAVQHAYTTDEDDGEIELWATATSEELWVLVSDAGCGLEPRDDSPGLGQGLRLIAWAADHLTIVSRGGGGTELWMGFRLNGRY